MIGWRIAASMLLAGQTPSLALAQDMPMPGAEDPRLQTLEYREGRRARLISFPDAPLTLTLRPGERVTRAYLSDEGAFSVSVVGASDSLAIASRRAGAVATLSVTTNMGEYLFDLETGNGLSAAYLVRVINEDTPPPGDPTALSAMPAPEQMTGVYRLSGDRSIMPATIGDDGTKTYISWDRYQALPAVFGIGPAGNEEVVDGYMRGDHFTIDRVYEELVFRIDKERVRARRRSALVAR